MLSAERRAQEAEKGRGCPTGAEANLRDPPHLKSLALDLDIRADIGSTKPLRGAAERLTPRFRLLLWQAGAKMGKTAEFNRVLHMHAWINPDESCVIRKLLSL
jgi:hypothetical protein